jgi:hypothetical protein
MVTLRVPDDDRAVRDGPVTVIVSGVGRSGTSMVAKVLDALGVPMGRTDGLEVFEDQDFIRALISFDYNHMRQIIRNTTRRIAAGASSSRPCRITSSRRSSSISATRA